VEESPDTSASPPESTAPAETPQPPSEKTPDEPLPEEETTASAADEPATTPKAETRQEQEPTPEAPPLVAEKPAEEDIAPPKPAVVMEPAAPAPAPATETEAPPEAAAVNTDLLAMAIPREKRPPKVLPDLMTLLLNDRRPTDARTAYMQLFRYWQLDFDGLPGNTACVRALSVGLRCIQKTGSFRRLTAYNRPAVLTLFDNRGRVHYITLCAVEENQLTVNIGGQEYRFDQEDILSVWNGQFVLLWRPTIMEYPMLQVGSRGTDVLWLRDQLARLEGGSPLSEQDLQNDYFDEGLRQQVIRFQKRRGVMADGIVGENTLLQLNAALDEGHTPVLSAPTQEATN
jgi:general secretion pathway protein A